MRPQPTLLTLVLLAIGLALPSAASAGTATSDSAGDDPAATPNWSYRAADGEKNDLTITISRGSTTLRDSAGVTAGRGCTSVDAQTARCPAEYGGAKLYDGDDRAVIKGVASAAVFGGDGNDTLTGGPGADFLRGEYGDDTLTGGPGGDGIQGKDGNDRIFAADGGPDEVLCSRGRDRVVGDRVDRALTGCEKPKLRGRMFSTLSVEVGNDELDAIELEGGQMETFTAVLCRYTTVKCQTSGRIIGPNGVIASATGDTELGGSALDWRYPREALGVPLGRRRLDVKIELTVKQRGKTERRTIPFTLQIEQPRPQPD